MTLSVRHKMTLDLAGTPYRYPAARETAALELLGYKPVRFWAVVDRLLDDPAAVAYAPLVVRRLSRLREKRRAARTGGFSASR